MSAYTINGKSTDVGDKVAYTAHDGRKHTLAIKNLTQSYADLEGPVDGVNQNFTSVPHHISGSAHTWNHIEHSANAPVNTPLPQTPGASGPEYPGGQQASFE